METLQDAYSHGDNLEEVTVDIDDDLAQFEDEEAILAKSGLYARVIPWVCGVHNNRLHNLPLLLCQCQGKGATMQVLLAMHLFPAAFHQVQTVFMLDVLEDFWSTNLDCKTAAPNFYAKLQ